MRDRLEETDRRRPDPKHCHVLKLEKLNRKHDISCTKYLPSVSLNRYTDPLVGIDGITGLLTCTCLHDHLETRCDKPGSYVWHQGDAPLTQARFSRYSDLYR